MAGEKVPLVENQDSTRSLLMVSGEKKQNEHDIIVFAQLMYLHKKAFEEGTGLNEDKELLCDFARKSRIMRSNSGLAQAASSQDDPRVFNWIGNLSKETADPWESLKKLSDVWKDLRIPDVCGYIEALGPFAYPFLHSLAVKIPRHLLKQRCLQREKLWKHVLSFPGKFEKGEDGLVFEHLDEVAPEIAPERTCMETIMQCNNKIEVEIHFGQLRNLVQYPSIEGNDFAREHLLLAVTLLDAAESTTLFATPVGQALAGNCWDVAFPQFVRHKVMEGLALFVLIFLIAPVSHRMQEGEHWPDAWKIGANLFFATYSFLTIVLEACMALANPLLMHAYLNTYNLLALLVEIVSVCFVIWACHDFWFMRKHMDWELTFLYQHPMAFGVLIFMKWLQLMISMINFNGLASTLLPAWCAIKSPESVVFLLYLFLLSLGSCFAYYVLPLDLGPFPASHFEAFFRMIRLGFLGDFEMSELEGKELHINKTTMAIEDSAGISEIKESLKGYVMVLGLFFPVILLNVYVGLLSEEYKKAKDNQVHLIASFRTASVFRLHLHRLFWSKCSWCPNVMSLDCFRQSIPNALKKAKLTDAEEISKLGTWILTPASYGTSPCTPGTHKLFLDVANALLSDHSCTS